MTADRGRLGDQSESKDIKFVRNDSSGTREDVREGAKERKGLA